MYKHTYDILLYIIICFKSNILYNRCTHLELITEYEN